MSTETIPLPAEVTAAELPAPVAAETDKSATQDDTTPKADEAAGEPKDTTEKELTPGELKRKERNRERWQNMKADREQALQRAIRAEQQLARLTKPQDFAAIEDPDERIAAMSAHKVQESFAEDHRVEAQDARKQAEVALSEAWTAISADMRERTPDFDAVVTRETPIHARSVPFIVESDKAGEIAYYLGKHPDEARDLFDKFENHPAKALVHLGRIEASIGKPAKAVSQAPRPAPVLSGASSPPSFDAKTAGVSDMQAMLRKAGILR